MENEYFKEIMGALKDISVEQAALKERVEANIKVSSRTVEELERTTKKVERHDTFVKVSLWFYGLIISGLGLKYINPH